MLLELNMINLLLNFLLLLKIFIIIIFLQLIYHEWINLIMLKFLLLL